jgi:short-subunit dehydrogenase
VVVITGAGSGIGRSTALAFARRGCRLVLGDINLKTVEQTAADAHSRFSAQALALVCDVRRNCDIDGLVQEAMQRFGRFDVMVNNAGGGYYARVEDTPPEDLRELFDLNVLSVQRGIRAVVPIMRRQGSGHIVIVGSVNGKQSWPYHGPYSATKFALTGLAQALRMELMGSGVSSTLILPMNVQTHFFEAAKLATPGYQPRPIGSMRSAASVARKIVSSVDRAPGEVNTVPLMRMAYVLSESMPGLATFVGARWYRRHQPPASG